MTTATAKTTPENYDPIGWRRKINRAARAGRTLVEFFGEVCQMTTRNFQIYSFNHNVTQNGKSFILCLITSTVPLTVHALEA